MDGEGINPRGKFTSVVLLNIANLLYNYLCLYLPIGLATLNFGHRIFLLLWAVVNRFITGENSENK